MYDILYNDLIDGGAFLRLRPGKRKYICFDKKNFKGNLDRTLDALIQFREAEMALTERQKQQPRAIYLDRVPGLIRARQDFEQRVVGTATQEVKVKFCQN